MKKKWKYTKDEKLLAKYGWKPPTPDEAIERIERDMKFASDKRRNISERMEAERDARHLAGKFEPNITYGDLWKKKKRR